MMKGLATDPYNPNHRIPVYAGDDMDVVFKNALSTLENDDVGLGEADAKTDGKQWAWNKWSTKIDRDNMDVTVLNPKLERGDDNRVGSRASNKNY